MFRYFKLTLFFIILVRTSTLAGPQISASRYELLSGVKKSKDKIFWEKKYNQSKYVYGKNAAKFLSQNQNYIPKNSKVLDLGMGEGRNSIFLARKGHKVLGIDISLFAINKAKKLAHEFGVKIESINASVYDYKFKKESFDVIICFYFVDRNLNDKMISWLRPGGILIYEAYTDLQRSIKGQENQDRKYLLRELELLDFFEGMRILKYEEPLHQKEFTASLILKKPFK